MEATEIVKLREILKIGGFWLAFAVVLIAALAWVMWKSIGYIP